MLKPDEVTLAVSLLGAAEQTNGSQPGIDAVLACVATIPIPENRLYYLLEKWSGKGLWDYGVTCRSGWFTDDGLDWARSLRNR